MPAPVIPTAGYVARLAALIATLYAEDDLEAKMRLYKNDVSPDANMTADTFEEADFTGYAIESVAFNAPSQNDQGMIVTRSALFSHDCPAGSDVQTIYGFYLTNLLGDVVLAAQRFELPQVVGGPLPTSIAGVFRMSEPLSTYGWIDVEA